MAFAESDRVQLRHYLGFGGIFLQADPRLESAITTVQSIADGGTRPDDSTETWLRGRITKAQSIETKLEELWDTADVAEADKGDAKVDAQRGMLMLRAEGRRVVHSMCRMLGMRGPRADIFSGGQVFATGSPFAVEEYYP